MAEKSSQPAPAEAGEPEDQLEEEEEDFEELEPDLKGLVEYVARALVDKPNAVKVDEVQDGNTTVYELEVDEEDIGKVIGRQGRVVRGLRALVKAAATRKGVRVDLDVVWQPRRRPGPLGARNPRRAEAPNRHGFPQAALQARRARLPQRSADDRQRG